jgi:hypothetical protein
MHAFVSFGPFMQSLSADSGHHIRAPDGQNMIKSQHPTIVSTLCVHVAETLPRAVSGTSMFILKILGGGMAWSSGETLWGKEHGLAYEYSQGQGASSLLGRDLGQERVPPPWLRV